MQRPIARILVAIDHSLGSEAIVDYACAIARGVSASITLIHVFEPPNELVGMVPGATVDGEREAERVAGGGLLERARTRAHDTGVPRVDIVLERASGVARTILGHAHHFDLIVMGTHGRKGVARLVLGSTAEQVLRDAPCPVLTVHLPHE